MSPTEDEEWTKPIDKHILELLERTRDAKLSGLWLTPATIARNLDVTRPYTSTRLRTLLEQELVQTDDNGYYRITETGSEYIRSRD